MRLAQSYWKMALSRSIWRDRSTRFQASTTAVCFICGRRNEMRCAACSRPKSKMGRFGSRCNEWARRGPRSWRFAANATGVRHRLDEFTRFGYFEGRDLSPGKPLLFLVAPAFHVHPATDTLLRYLSPEIEWEFVGIDERWREGVKVVFRKRPDRGTRIGPNLPTGAAA